MTTSLERARGATLPEAIPPETLARLPTPCLLVDLAAADRNIARAADYYAKAPVKLRPHFKAHKCTQLMRRQLAAGGCVGVTCATPHEAEVLAHEGFPRILVANQVINREGLRALSRAARQAQVSVAVDSLAHVNALTRTAAEQQVRFGVLIEIDVGMGRCGLPLGSDQLVPIARAIKASKRLDFEGLQGYEGHAVHKDDRALRRTMVWQAAQVLRAERARLEEAGFECQVISGGGSGTWDLAEETGVWTDIQAGSYVLMDSEYGSLNLPFEPALYCAATVISRRSSESGVLNAGLKELTVEGGMPRPVRAGLRVLGLSDEHARLAVAPGTSLEVGDTVLMIPGHIDPAINLHPALVVWEGGGQLSLWPVDGRRALTSLD
ncbi:MAG: alanine racemase [Chloroflexi bacterium]|nr:alanine racemase [Chloroflexota bacterium]